VAVITEVPAPATVARSPFREITEEVAEEYVKVPGKDPVTVGAVRVKSPFSKTFETLLHVEKVGVALPIVRDSIISVAAK
jgi:hypothetical protein